MRINVKAKPNSKEEKVEKINSKNYKVFIKETAEKGKANTALIKALAKYFGIHSSQIKIKSGLTSHNKIIELTKGTVKNLGSLK